MTTTPPEIGQENWGDDLNAYLAWLETQATEGNALPAGGTVDQVLAKASSDDFDTQWADAAVGNIPSGGTTGQAMTKSSNTDYDVGWSTVSGGAGVTDGDKGDIVVSGSGATWALDSGVVTAAARSVLDDTTTTAMRTTLGLGNVDNTADASKPVSTATTTALGLKADKTTTVTTTAPLTGSGPLGSNLTLGISNFTTAVKGAVPPPTTVTGKFLKDDGTWDTPSTSGDVVWVGTGAPSDADIELWYDTNEPLGDVLDQSAADLLYVNLSGDTMTGALTLPGSPINPLEAATKAYVDAAAGGGGGGGGAVEPYNLTDRFNSPAAFTRPDVDDYPTITVANGQEAGSTSISGGVAHRPFRTGGGGTSVNLDPVNDPKFRYGGMSTTNPATPVTSFNDFVALPLKTGGASQFAYFIWHITFETDAAAIDFSLMDRSGSAYALGISINGRMRSETVYRPSVTAGNRFGMKLTFPNSKWRRIELWAQGNTGWGGVWLPAGALVRRPLAPVTRKAVIIGDSITNGVGVDSPVGYAGVVESIGPRLMQRLGADDIMLMGIGATGWSSASTSSFGGDRLTMALATNPQIMMFVGSVNDVGMSTGALTTAVTNAMTACAAVPNVWVAGSHFNTHATMNATMKAAVEAAGRVYVDIGAFAPTDPVYMQSDNIHPTFAGQKVLTDMMWAGMSGLNHKVNNSGGVTAIRALTQAAYDALSPPHPTTFYVIIP